MADGSALFSGFRLGYTQGGSDLLGVACILWGAGAGDPKAGWSWLDKTPPEYSHMTLVTFHISLGYATGVSLQKCLDYGLGQSSCL